MSTPNPTIGPYRLLEKLGANRRHNVFRAVHQETEQVVALKVVNITSRVDFETAQKKIKLEIKILQRFDHANLVKVLDGGIVDTKMYIAMELIEGETLAAILSRRGKLAWDQAIDYARQIAEGLDYLHKQEMVHLKLNPEKILIMPDGQVKIGDLRLNRAKKRRWDETKRRVLDIAAYMAPEQMTVEGGTAKSDIYGLGVLLFEMITGKLPFEPDTLPRMLKAKRESQAPHITNIVVDCPVFIDGLVAQMLEGLPASRPHSAYAIVVTLREIQRLHAEGRSIAEEMTRGFNPLTAGRDKSEAMTILGQQKKSAPFELERYTTAMIAASLVVVVTVMSLLMWWVLQPPSEAKLYRQAKAAMDREVTDRSLIQARRALVPLLKRYPEGEHAEEAAEMLESVRAQLAERRMRRRYRLSRNPANETEELIVQAWQLEEVGDRQNALKFYQEAFNIEPEDEEAEDFHLLAKRKIATLEKDIEENEPTLEEQRARIIEQLARAAQLRADGDVVEAGELLRTMEASIGDNEELQDLVDQIKGLLNTGNDQPSNDEEPDRSEQDQPDRELEPTTSQ